MQRRERATYARAGFVESSDLRCGRKDSTNHRAVLHSGRLACKIVRVSYGAIP